MKLLDALIELLYPTKCPFCGRVMDRRTAEPCLRCRAELPWTSPADERHLDGCDGCFAPLWYRDGVRDAVHRLKFEGGQNHAALFGKLMARCFDQRGEEEIDVVTWAPLSKKRLRQRGYDQAKLLAERTAAELGLPTAALLEKARDTKAQSTLEDEAERRANVAGAYRLAPGMETSCAGRRILLVDDVVTTGNTIGQCANALKQAGAASVTVLSLAWARK